ncbi:MAG: hypothetical protein WKG07_48960 [Hymenobacter sp.]
MKNPFPPAGRAGQRYPARRLRLPAAGRKTDLVKAADKAVELADTATQGAKPRLITTFPDSMNTPDGLALLPDGRVLLSIPNMADNQYPGRIVELTANGYKPFLSHLPPSPPPSTPPQWTWQWAPTAIYTTLKTSTKTARISSRA